MHRKVFFLVVTAIIAGAVVNSGCQEIEKLRSKRDVTENVFTSSSIPETAIKIHTDLKLIDKTGPTKTVATQHQDVVSSLEKESYLFAKTDEENVASRGVIIRLTTISGDPNLWDKELAFDYMQCLQSGTIDIRDEEYAYCTRVSADILFDNEKELLREKGLSVAKCALIRDMARHSGFGNKFRLAIVYFEDCNLDENRVFVDIKPPLPLSGTLSEPQNAAFDAFLKRSNAYVQILPKAESTATGGRIYEGAPVPAGSDTIEKKLETLKNLYDKGLITKEEYDRKKSELLNKL